VTNSAVSFLRQKGCGEWFIAQQEITDGRPAVFGGDARVDPANPLAVATQIAATSRNTRSAFRGPVFSTLQPP
jgi:hypothetical protein